MTSGGDGGPASSMTTQRPLLRER
ncbi:uncharacterized protein G2W53_034169 [Senna tora]|uniref:Uncharacterized protein n=1 Tax=Senna tora TaxID=362788 RepID=A0A834T0Y0_9FABA|nr:uncharacterized protein G2W53_034169 [Senna tora]